MIEEAQLSEEARINLKEAMDAYVANGMEISTEVADIKISLAKLFKKDEYEQNTTGHFKFLLEAIDILEFCLGFDHPETGEAYSKMGLAS